MVIKTDKNPEINKQVMMLLSKIMEQNYFQYIKKCYKPQKGIAMGSPISGYLAEIYTQGIEETHIKHWIESKEIIYYRRYLRDTPLSAKVGTSFADRRRPLCRPKPCRAVAPLDYYYYRRYLDDIFILYNQNKTNEQQIFNRINRISKHLQTKTNSEVDDKIQFLDLTIHKKKHNMTINIYRKPTETDTTINYHSIITPLNKKWRHTDIT